MEAQPIRRRSSFSEPWRFRCPDCGSVSVRRLTGKERVAGKRYQANGRGKVEAQRDAQRGFRCDRCGERKKRLLDMKRGKEVLHK